MENFQIPVPQEVQYARAPDSETTRVSVVVSSMGRADLLWPRVDLNLTRKVRSNTGRVNVDQRWARLEAGRGGDSFDPLWPDHMGQRRPGSEVRQVAEKVDHARSEVRGNML